MTRVVIAGGHGKIALILERLLTQRGDSVAGFIRNPEHSADLEAAGAAVVVLDLEQASVDEVAAHLEAADAVVFAAGAGPGSGAARKETVDRDAAILLADAAEAAKSRDMQRPVSKGRRKWSVHAGRCRGNIRQWRNPNKEQGIASPQGQKQSRKRRSCNPSLRSLRAS